MHSILCSQKFSNRLCFRKQAVVYKTKGHQTLNIAFILITLLPDFFNRPACFYSPFRSPLQHPTLDPTFLDLFKSAPIKIYSYFFSAVFLLFLSGKHTLCKFTSLFDSLLADFAFLCFPLFTNKWPRFIKFYCLSFMEFLRLIWETALSLFCPIRLSLIQESLTSFPDFFIELNEHVSVFIEKPF